eukprot:g1734.t1
MGWWALAWAVPPVTAQCDIPIFQQPIPMWFKEQAALTLLDTPQIQKAGPCSYLDGRASCCDQQSFVHLKGAYQEIDKDLGGLLTGLTDNSASDVAKFLQAMLAYEDPGLSFTRRQTDTLEAWVTEAQQLVPSAKRMAGALLGYQQGVFCLGCDPDWQRSYKPGSNVTTPGLLSLSASTCQALYDDSIPFLTLLDHFFDRTISLSIDFLDASDGSGSKLEPKKSKRKLVGLQRLKKSSGGICHFLGAYTEPKANDCHSLVCEVLVKGPLVLDPYELAGKVPIPNPFSKPSRSGSSSSTSSLSASSFPSSNSAFSSSTSSTSSSSSFSSSSISSSSSSSSSPSSSSSSSSQAETEARTTRRRQLLQGSRVSGSESERSGRGDQAGAAGQTGQDNTIVRQDGEGRPDQAEQQAGADRERDGGRVEEWEPRELQERDLEDKDRGLEDKDRGLEDKDRDDREGRQDRLAGGGREEVNHTANLSMTFRNTYGAAGAYDAYAVGCDLGLSAFHCLPPTNTVQTKAAPRSGRALLVLAVMVLGGVIMTAAARYRAKRAEEFSLQYAELEEVSSAVEYVAPPLCLASQPDPPTEPYRAPHPTEVAASASTNSLDHLIN